MIIGTGKIYLYVNWIHSLKEKRMIVKSLIARVKNKFNVSVAEIESQDYHQTIVIGICCVSNDTRHANSTIENVLDFIENSTDAVVQDRIIEIF